MKAVSLRALIAVPFALGALAACANNKAALDDPCLRPEDCLTGVCIAFTCSSVLSVTDTPSSPSDAGADTSVRDAAPVEASVEADATSD